MTTKPYNEDGIPFTREELARLLEDANRMIAMLRERAEVLEKALRSLVAASSESYEAPPCHVVKEAAEVLQRIDAARLAGSR